MSTSILKNQLDKNVKSDEKLNELFKDLKEINANYSGLLKMIKDNANLKKKIKNKIGEKFIKLSKRCTFFK